MMSSGALACQSLVALDNLLEDRCRGKAGTRVTEKIGKAFVIPGLVGPTTNSELTAKDEKIR